jgi:hypothetical protein
LVSTALALAAIGHYLVTAGSDRSMQDGVSFCEEFGD